MEHQTEVVRPNRLEVALGDALEWTVQRWVAWTGRTVSIVEAPWLAGPVGKKRIGPGFYEAYGREAGFEVVREDPEAGLLPNFGALEGEGFDPRRVRPEIRRFYEKTALYNLDLTYRWSGLFRNPPRTLIYFVSRNTQQVNLPISPLAGRLEVTNELIRLTDRAAGEVPYTGWLRRVGATGEVILAGFYGICELPGHGGRFVRGLYPLPNGSVSVVFRPQNEPDGSFTLVSDGRRFGEAGYYRIDQTDFDVLRVVCVPIQEVVRVFVDSTGTLRAQHTFALEEITFLTLSYEITPCTL